MLILHQKSVAPQECVLNDGYQEEWEQGKLGRDAKHAVGGYAEVSSGMPTTISDHVLV